MLEGFTTYDDAAKEAAEGFGPLKVVLGSIPALYANLEVRLRPPAQSSSLTNASAGNHRRWKKNRRPALTYGRIGGTFCHAPRRRARAEAPARTDTVCNSSPSRFDIDFLPANSRSSRGSCGRYTKSQGCSGLMTGFKTMKVSSGSLRICERPSPIIRFVRHLGTVLDADRGEQRVQQVANYERGCRAIVSVPLACLNK